METNQDLIRTLWGIAKVTNGGYQPTCSCGAPEWEDTGRCRQCWERDEEEIDAYYYTADK